MNNQNRMHAIYETDDIKQARLVATNCKEVSVTYRNPNRTIPPILTFVMGGKRYTKYNPEYVELLNKKYPGISDSEISKYINEAIEEFSSKRTDKFEGKIR